jgi:TnpA family transposase
VSKSEKRISILSAAEVSEIYDRPNFSSSERECYFELEPHEQSLINTKADIETKIDLILQLGYFKCKRTFFDFPLSDVEEDLVFVANKYFDNVIVRKPKIGREARSKNQIKILSVNNYARYSKSKHLAVLQSVASKSILTSNNPEFILREILDYLYSNKIIAPGYSTLQDIVSYTILAESDRIESILDKYLSGKARQKILDLLTKEGTIYEITELKKQPKNFKPMAIKSEVSQFEKYNELYEQVKKLLPRLKLSNNSINYFADLVDHYTVQGLVRGNDSQVILWLICFIYQRFRKILDNLSTMLIFIARQYQNDVKDKAHELLIEESLDKDQNNDNLAKLLRLYVDKSIDDSKPFKDIKNRAFKILGPDKINHLSNKLEERGKDLNNRLHWQAVDQFSNKQRNILRLLLATLPLQCEQHKSLIKAINFQKKVISKELSFSKTDFSNIPKRFIDNRIMHHIVNSDEKEVYQKRYEYQLYMETAKYLDSRTIFVDESNQYRSLTSDLVPGWKKDKNKIIRSTNRKRLQAPLSDFITDVVKPLDDKIIRVNDEISSGNNPNVKIKTDTDGNKIWTLPYTKASIELNNPIYEALPTTSISRVLCFVNQQINYLQYLTHIKPHRSKSKADLEAVNACLVANGTNLGIEKMAEICDLDYQRLLAADKSHLRSATLREVNKAISEETAKLRIFKYWDFREDLLHASLDGQKFKTRFDSLLARHSKKYFGRDKGVVAYSMVANHIPLISRIIGANEHESKYLFDLIYNNKTSIQPDIFSTDTEGSNQLNYLLLYFIDRAFAPRYRSLTDRTENIVSYASANKYKNLLIKPKKKANVKLMLSEEDNIKHIIASLLIGNTSQCDMISKLSNKNFKSKTKLALWEMNSVLMSDYLLDYISDILLRQSVHGSLNRGEAYHQLRRHIAIVNGKHFRGTTEKEIDKWNECARLLANAVIFYNATLLSNLLETYEALGMTEICDGIKRLSPVAWTHINFYGQYEFLAHSEQVDLHKIIQSVSREKTEAAIKQSLIIV